MKSALTEALNNPTSGKLYRAVVSPAENEASYSNITAISDYETTLNKYIAEQFFHDKTSPNKDWQDREALRAKLNKLGENAKIDAFSICHDITVKRDLIERVLCEKITKEDIVPEIFLNAVQKIIAAQEALQSPKSSPRSSDDEDVFKFEQCQISDLTLNK